MPHKLCRSFHPWCPGVKTRCLSLNGDFLWSRWPNIPSIPGACATRNFTYLIKGPFYRRSDGDKTMFHWLFQFATAAQSAETSQRALKRRRWRGCGRGWSTDVTPASLWSWRRSPPCLNSTWNHGGTAVMTCLHYDGMVEPKPEI